MSKRRANLDDLERDGKPGDFIYSEGRATIIARCPGSDGLFSLALQEIDGNPYWRWDGCVERPTLTPSVRHPGLKQIVHSDAMCHWHGFLHDGDWLRA